MRGATLEMPRAIVPLTLAVALVGACARPAPTPVSTTTTAPPAASVRTTPVVRADLSSTLSYSGDVKAKASLTVVPRASGRVEKLMVDVGSPVKVGDVIAELDRDAASLVLKQNQAALAAARARLATLQSGARPEVAEAAAANARAAEARSQSLQNAARPESVTQAVVQAESARQRAAALAQGRAELVDQADAAVALAQAKLDELKRGPTPEQVGAREIAVQQAQLGYESAVKTRDGLCGPGGAPCATARANVLTAEAAVRQAQQQLAILKTPPTAEAIEQAQATVDAARQQAELVRRPVGEFDLAAAQAQVRAAEAGVAAAQRPVVAGDIAAAQAQADAARAGAALAASPYTKEDVAAQQALVAQAQAAVDSARAALDDLTVTSPVDGVVSERQTVVGAVASPATPLVTIVSPESEVAVNVEESQLPNVKVGQAATLTVAAFPGEPMAGKVASVAPTLDPKSRTAVVEIEPGAEAASKLRPGMFAQVGIVLETKRGVLAVPRSALLPGAAPAVMAVVDGTLKRVPVQTGLRQGDRVEVTDGLKEGDEVAIDATNLREGDRVALASA